MLPSRKYSLWFLCSLGLALCVTSTSFAQLVKQAPKAEEASAVDAFLKAVSKKAGKNLGADELDGPLPAALSALDGVQEATFLGIVKEFETSWTAYSSRKREVETALDAARSKESSADVAGAIALITAVISPVEAKADGTVEKRESYRDILLPSDAEYPALEHLLKLSAAAEDWDTYVAAATIIGRRRPVGSHGEERLIWLANNRFFKALPGSGELGDAMNGLIAEAHRRIDGARYDGVQRLSTMADLGVKKIILPNAKGSKKGQWVIIGTSMETQGKVGTANRVHKGETPYDCRDTKKLDRIDGSGTIHYIQKCKWKKFEEKLDLTIDFKSELPAWAQGNVFLVAIGKVKKSGDKWHLVDAVPVSTDFGRTFRTMLPPTR